MTDEIWKPVVGHEGHYEVSDQGRVRSLDRYYEGRSRSGNPVMRALLGRFLKPAVAANGYRTVVLSREGQKRTHTVPSLVLAAFVGPRPEGMVCRHLNDIRVDDVLLNLRWGTPSENNKDITTNGGRIFTRHEAENIRREARAGKAQIDLAEKYGCSRRHINYIVNEKQYVA